MQVNVTREEIKTSAALLSDLELWEKLAGITGTYNKGKIRLFVHGTGGEADRIVSLEPYGRRDSIEDKISGIMSTHVDSAIGAIIKLIKKELPIPLEK